MAKEHSGGRLGRNFRPGQIAESLAINLCLPFLAVARVEQENDFGVDFIGTLLRQSKRVLVAEDSCLIQVKIASAAQFSFKGEGVDWLRQLVLPYFPLVLDLSTATAAVYTLNDWHRVIFPSRVNEYVFVLEEDMQNDPGDNYFSLGEPLLSWSINDATHRDFPRWAYSVLKPAIKIEGLNQRYGSAGRFAKLVGRSYRFADRGTDGIAKNPPVCGKIEYSVPWDEKKIFDDLCSIITPFANLVANSGAPQARSEDLRQLKAILRRLNFDPDVDGMWEKIIEGMQEYEK